MSFESEKKKEREWGKELEPEPISFNEPKVLFRSLSLFFLSFPFFLFLSKKLSSFSKNHFPEVTNEYFMPLFSIKKTGRRKAIESFSLSLSLPFSLRNWEEEKMKGEREGEWIFSFSFFCFKSQMTIQENRKKRKDERGRERERMFWGGREKVKGKTEKQKIEKTESDVDFNKWWRWKVRRKFLLRCFDAYQLDATKNVSFLQVLSLSLSLSSKVLPSE